ncbi:MAG: XRE family transcriptional regulator [Holosporales bacterium]|nr:XRE family transcriptional regulator [Holosporales bacterium]
MTSTPFLSTPGSRLRAIRAFCAPSRNEFCEKTGLSESTLKAWENDVARLTKKGAALLAIIFQRQGVYCTEEWLLNGEGLPPLRQLHEASNQNMAEDVLIQQEVDSLKRYYKKNVFSFKVSDNSMSPQFKSSDWVAGILIDTQDLPYFWEEIVIADVEGYGILLRKLTKGTQPGMFNLIALNPQDANAGLLNDVRLKGAYRILWHRRLLGELRSFSPQPLSA